MNVIVTGGGGDIGGAWRASAGSPGIHRWRVHLARAGNARLSVGGCFVRDAGLVSRFWIWL